MPCIDLPSNPQTISTTLAAHQYFTMNVIQGLTYQVYTCNTTSPANPLKLVVYKEGAPSDPYIALSYSNAGNPCTSAANNVYVSFTPGFSGQVRILINRKSDCSASTPSGLTVNVNVSDGSNTLDDESAAGSDSWIGHIYDGMDFDNYLGYYNQTEAFEESFGSTGTWPNMLSDDLSCFNVYSDGQIRGSVKIVTFSVRYRMNSSRSGLYLVKLTSDDGARLYVDGNQVFSDWTQHSPTVYSNVLLPLSGSSSLAYEYFENTGQNVVGFENLVQVIANTLSANTTQSICLGNSGSAISGDVFGTLPSGISLSGTGYQWQFSNSSSSGPWTDISGATSATYTPSTVTAPFNSAGTYYIIRKASLSSANNVSPNPSIAAILSNAAVVTVSPVSVGGTVSGGSTICSGNTSNLLTLSGYTGTIIKWQSSVSPFTTWTDIANTSATYTSGVLTQTTQFRAVVQSGNCGTVNSSATTVTVNPNLPVSITIAASANPVCAGTSVTFTATPTNGGTAPSYQWKLNGTNVGTNSSTYTNGALSDGNTVSCIMTSNAGCATGTPATSNTITMTVNANLPVSVTIAASANPVCSGSSVTFTATPINGGTAPTYQWKLNGSNVGTNSSTYTNSSLANGNTVSCVLTSNATCTTGNPATSNTVTMTVNPVLPVSVTISASVNPVCSGVSVTFTATPANGGSSPAYQWQLNGSNAGTNSATYVTSSLVNGDVVSCVLTSNAVCTSGNPATSNPVTITITATGTWLGTTSTDWNVPGNWSCNTVPDITTNIQIPNVTNKPVISSGATGTAKNIVIASGSSLTVTGNTLQIAGTITNSGTFTASAGTIEMKGSSAQVIGSNIFAGNAVMNLTINNSSGVTLQGSLNVSGVVTITSGNLASGGYLTLLSTAAQTSLINGAGAGNVTGNVTMQRYLAAGFGYKYFSSPFQAATVNEFADDLDLTASFPTFFKYDESAVSSGWISYTSTSGTLVPMQGYAANMGTSLVAKTVTMTGVVNNGTMGPVTLYNHNNTYTLGYNLEGNPYPSPIDWNAASGWTKTNIDNAIYYYNNGSTDQYTGTYSTYINGISSDGIANNIIPSMQGFFIHVSNGTYPVTAQFGMNNNVRVNTLSPVFHKAIQADTRSLLRLTAAFDNEGAINDPLVIYFDDVTSNAFDRDHDALKITNTDYGVPNIYAISADGKRVSIKAIPISVDSSTIIPLGLKIFSDDWIRIKVAEIERIQSDLNVYLYDAETKIYRNLTSNQDCRFYVHTGNNENRFSIVFSKKELKYGSGNEGEFLVYSAGKKIFVYAYLAPGETGEITVYNMLGQALGKQKVQENTLHELNFNLHDGVYIVEFSSQSGIKSKKVLITDQ